MGTETALELYKQREQMQRIHYKTQVIDSKLKKSDWVLNSMKSTWGLIKNAFKKVPEELPEQPKQGTFKTPNASKTKFLEETKIENKKQQEKQENRMKGLQMEKKT